MAHTAEEASKAAIIAWNAEADEIEDDCINAFDEVICGPEDCEEVADEP